MFKNRFLLVLGLLSVLLITMAISRPFASAPTAGIMEANRLSDYHERHPGLNGRAANDYYQRHPDWTRATPNIAVPVTGESAYLDYYQRHFQSGTSAAIAADTSDYFLRHPGLRRGLPWSTHTILPPSLMDDCFDVSVNEIAACRAASQSASQ